MILHPAQGKQRKAIVRQLALCLLLLECYSSDALSGCCYVEPARQEVSSLLQGSLVFVKALHVLEAYRRASSKRFLRLVLSSDTVCASSGIFLVALGRR